MRGTTEKGEQDETGHPWTDLSTKRTHKREFLDKMDQVVPWAELTLLIEPYYPKGKTGRPRFGRLVKLRIHFLQHWFGLSAPAMEDALHDIPLYRDSPDWMKA